MNTATVFTPEQVKAALDHNPDARKCTFLLHGNSGTIDYLTEPVETYGAQILYSFQRTETGWRYTVKLYPRGPIVHSDELHVFDLPDGPDNTVYAMLGIILTTRHMTRTELRAWYA